MRVERRGMRERLEAPRDCSIPPADSRSRLRRCQGQRLSPGRGCGSELTAGQLAQSGPGGIAIRVVFPGSQGLADGVRLLVAEGARPHEVIEALLRRPGM